MVIEIVGWFSRPNFKAYTGRMEPGYDVGELQVQDPSHLMLHERLERAHTVDHPFCHWVDVPPTPENPIAVPSVPSRSGSTRRRPIPHVQRPTFSASSRRQKEEKR